jgi:hypothetical protein
MKKTTAALLVGSLIGLVIYVSVLSAALVRDLNSTRTDAGYSSSTNAYTADSPKLEVASTAEKGEGRAQAAKVTKHHRARQIGRHQRIKTQKDGVTLMI